MATNNYNQLDIKPTFSIITSLRKKYELYFGDLFNHILNQTYTNYECIVIVDEDDICLPSLDDRFRVLKVEPQWLSTKRNIGIREAKGDYIIFCDADDYLDDSALSVFYEAIEENAPDIIFPRVTRDPNDLYNNKVDNYLYLNKDGVEDFFFSRYIYPFYKNDIYTKDGCWGRAYKRKMLIDNKIMFVEEPCRAEDAIFNNDVALKATSMVITPSYFGYFWRKNDSSEMNNINSPFYSIYPFGENIKRQLHLCNEKYRKDSLKYVSYILKGQISTFYRAYVRKMIGRKSLFKSLDSFIPDESYCKDSLLFLIKNTKSNYERIFYSKIYKGHYLQSILLFRYKLLLNKVKNYGKD